MSTTVGAAEAGAATAAPAEPATLRASALAALLLPAALVPLGSTTVAVATTAMADAVQTDPAVLTQWLVNSYLIAGIVLLSPAGKLVDVWGVRRSLLAGQWLFGTGAVLGLLAGSLALLVAARVMAAAGGALLVPATLVVLRTATPTARRARVFGLFGVLMGLAAALGPIAGGAMADTFGWRAVFLVNLGALAAAPWARSFEPWARTRRNGVLPPFDWPGSALLAAALLLALAGSRTAGGNAAALLAAAGVVLFAFVRWERRAPDPVLDPALFRFAPYAAGAVLVALHNWVMYGLIFQVPLWFEVVLESTRPEIGRALLAMLLSMVVCSALGGRLTDRCGARGVTVLGGMALLAGLLLLRWVPVLAGASDAVPALVLIGAGLGLSSAPSQSASLDAVPAGRSGMAAGALATCRYLGGIAGIGALGFVLRDTAMADAVPVLAAAHNRAVWIYCGVALLALVPAALLPARRPPGSSATPRPLSIRRDRASVG